MGHLKMNPPPPPSEKKTLSKPSSSKLFLEKIAENWKMFLIKQHWKRVKEIPQEHDFLTCSIQNLVRKVKQFVRKYYIT